MDDGITNDGAAEIERLHAQLAAESETGQTTEEIRADETSGNPADSPGERLSPNKDFCEEILATCLRWHADSVRNEFQSKLETVAGTDQARRIAERAAMSQEIQAAVAAHGSRVLCKYGVARFVNDEAVLVAAILSYWKNLSAARKERDAIIKKHSPAHGAQRDSATAGLSDFPAHETKSGNLNVEREPVPKITT
jgi:hypothetical protein